MSPTLIFEVIGYLALVIGLMVLVLYTLRRTGFGQGNKPFSKGVRARLRILEALSIDTRRKLLLVSRDDIEHLVMIGGGSDVLIEAGINKEEKTEKTSRKRTSALKPTEDNTSSYANAYKDVLPQLEQTTEKESEKHWESSESALLNQVEKLLNTPTPLDKETKIKNTVSNIFAEAITNSEKIMSRLKERNTDMPEKTVLAPENFQSRLRSQLQKKPPLNAPTMNAAEQVIENQNLKSAQNVDTEFSNSDKSDENSALESNTETPEVLEQHIADFAYALRANSESEMHTQIEGKEPQSLISDIETTEAEAPLSRASLIAARLENDLLNDLWEDEFLQSDIKSNTQDAFSNENSEDGENNTPENLSKESIPEEAQQPTISLETSGSSTATQTLLEGSIEEKGKSLKPKRTDALVAAVMADLDLIDIDLEEAETTQPNEVTSTKILQADLEEFDSISALLNKPKSVLQTAVEKKEEDFGLYSLDALEDELQRVLKERAMAGA